MHTVTSFHASAVQPDRLSEIMAAYLALERARIFRRLLVKRFSGLAMIVAGVSFLWLSVFPLWFSVGLCVVVPTWSWIVELGCEHRLARLLNEIPGQAMHVVESARPSPQS
jgi:hypothetical protein